MRALGLPREAPVSGRGLDYITMRALGSPIEAPFSDFARIGILMREQSVNRDECQCANGECQCANGDHRLRIVFSKTGNSSTMTQEKSVIVTNDR